MRSKIAYPVISQLNCRIFIAGIISSTGILQNSHIKSFSLFPDDLFNYSLQVRRIFSMACSINPFILPLTSSKMAACILASGTGFALTSFLTGGGTKKAVMARLKNKKVKLQLF